MSERGRYGVNLECSGSEDREEVSVWNEGIRNRDGDSIGSDCKGMLVGE